MQYARRRSVPSWSWLRPDVGSKKPLTARWSGTGLIVNIWHLLEFPGGNDTLTTPVIRTGALVRFLHFRFSNRTVI